jgi:hypothetical protein
MEFDVRACAFVFIACLCRCSQACCSFDIIIYGRPESLSRLFLVIKR